MEEAEADQAKEKAQKEHAAAQKQQKEASSAEESEKASEKMKKADLDMENAANKKKQGNAQAAMAEEVETPTKRVYSNLETRVNDSAEAEKEGVKDKAAFVKGYHAGRIDVKPTQPFMPKAEALLGEPEEAPQGDFTDLPRQTLFSENYVKRVASPPLFSISGPEKVSRKCNTTRKAECDDRTGCMWVFAKELRKGVSNGCVDAAKWECSVRKQIIDCVHYNDLSPANVFAPADDFCGRTFLAQAKYKIKYCQHGFRKNMACEHDNDCPITENDKKKNRVPRCKERYAVAGCQAATQQQCSDVDYKFLSAMMV